MLEHFQTWLHSVIKLVDLSSKIFIYLPDCGIGDRISCFPAFRILKKLNEDKKIILITSEIGIDVFKLCKYIDFVVPAEIFLEGPKSIFLRQGKDDGRICNWTFYEHHQQHVVKSAVKYIAGVDPNECDNYDLTYEFSVRDYHIEKAEVVKNELLEKSSGKKIIGIAPANTMLSRMWPVNYWEKLTMLLKKEFNSYVVSIVGPNDLNVSNVDYVVRTDVAVVPLILDIFANLITVSSGMLHIGSVNQEVKMTYLNIGQFPADLLLPFRKNNDIYYNRIIIEHNCPYKKQCFMGHITNVEINKQLEKYEKEYIMDTGRIFPKDQFALLQKYTCWHYCYKPFDKYSCSKLIHPEDVLIKLKQEGGI